MTTSRHRSFVLRLGVLPKHDGDGVQVRVSRAGRVGVHGYTPKRKAANAKGLHFLAMPHAPCEPWAGAIRLDTLFVFPTPKKWVEVGADRWSTLPHFERTPDLTNLRKQLEDALEGLFYVNDKQVCCGIMAKAWGGEACVRVDVAEITGDAFAALASLTARA